MPNRAIDYRELKRCYDLDGPRATCERLRAALEARALSAADFSLRDVAEALVPDGREWVRTLDPRYGTPVLESDGVDLSAFSNITGQLVTNGVMAGYTAEDFVLSRLIPSRPSRLDNEKVIGLGQIGDEAEEVAPGMPYPRTGFGEDYIELPAGKKRGLIVPVTKEAVFFDLTGQLLQRANEVGRFLGLNKEKRLVDLAIGVTNNYKWRGTSYNTYQTATPWINSISSNELLDWTDIEAMELLFADMLDPQTGEPIVMETAGMTMLVAPHKQHTARHILGATQIERVDNQANASTMRTITGNSVSPYKLEVSRLYYRRLIASGLAAAAAAKITLFGDFSRAFTYVEHWPIAVTQAPTNAEAEFNNDIVAQYKASERGVGAVLDPRYIVKSAG